MAPSVVKRVYGRPCLGPGVPPFVDEMFGRTKARIRAATLPHSEAEVLFASDASDGAGSSGGAGACWTGGDGSMLLNVDGKLPADPVELMNDPGGGALEYGGIRALHRAATCPGWPKLS